jgi:hypothetical protein
MSEIRNVRFASEEGVYFNAYIEHEERSFFVDIAILEDMTKNKVIRDKVKAEMALSSIRTQIKKMCHSAVIKNSQWPVEKTLPLSRL